MNTKINDALAKIEEMRDAGFTITDAELDAILASKVITKDNRVFRHAVQLARVAKNDMLLINSLDLPIAIPNILQKDIKLNGEQSFAIYMLAKDIALNAFGGIIVARDSQFHNELEHIDKGRQLRKAIKQDLYAIERDFKKKQIRTYGLSRLTNNTLNNADVLVDCSGLTNSQFESLYTDIQNHIKSKIEAGKFPTLVKHLEGFSKIKCKYVAEDTTLFEPLITPGPITCITMVAFGE